MGKADIDTSYNVQTAGDTLIGGNLDTKSGTNEISLNHTNYPKLKISNGTQEYWLIEGNGTGSNFASGDLYLYDSTNGDKRITIKQNNGGTIVGGDTLIGTEDISLQGSTLISKKLELSTTTDGVLLPRLTSAEKIAISGPDLNLIVFDTTLNSLQRWNGLAWVALAAGFGLVGTTDNAGSPTFYATVKAAYDSGQGSIKLYSDITENTSRIIQMVDGRDIDLNGFTYTYSATDGSNMFETSDQNCTFRIINGRLLRTGGLDTSTLLKLDKTQDQIDIINVYAENTNGICLNTKASIFNGFSSTFKTNKDNTLGQPAKVNGGTYINISATLNQSISPSHLQNAVFRVSGTGRNFVTNATINNCEFYGVSNTALNISNSTLIDSYCESIDGAAINVGGNATVIGCTAISLTNTAAKAAQTNSRLIKSTLISSGNFYSVFNVEFVEDCNVIMNGTGSGVGSSSRIMKVVNNVIKINSGSGNGIDFASIANSQAIGNTIYLNAATSIGVKSTNVNAYVSGNTIKGSTLGTNLGTGSNLFTATQDAQGNAAQL